MLSLGGTVIEKMAVAGMRVMPGEDLYAIADLSHLWILADIYEYELPFVRDRPDLQRSHSVLRCGGVHDRAPRVHLSDAGWRDAHGRGLALKLDNPGGTLKPDMYVNVALTVPLGERLIVPKDASAGVRNSGK
jgi:Cu(I)/Ag(I) efflux system membrane fusion protein